MEKAHPQHSWFVHTCRHTKGPNLQFFPFAMDALIEIKLFKQSNDIAILQNLRYSTENTIKILYTKYWIYFLSVAEGGKWRHEKRSIMGKGISFLYITIYINEFSGAFFYPILHNNIPRGFYLKVAVLERRLSKSTSMIPCTFSYTHTERNKNTHYNSLSIRIYNKRNSTSLWYDPGRSMIAYFRFLKTLCKFSHINLSP